MRQLGIGINLIRKSDQAAIVASVSLFWGLVSSLMAPSAVSFSLLGGGTWMLAQDVKHRKELRGYKDDWDSTRRQFLDEIARLEAQEAAQVNDLTNRLTIAGEQLQGLVQLNGELKIDLEIARTEQRSALQRYVAEIQEREATIKTLGVQLEENLKTLEAQELQCKASRERLLFRERELLTQVANLECELEKLKDKHQLDLTNLGNVLQQGFESYLEDQLKTARETLEEAQAQLQETHKELTHIIELKDMEIGHLQNTNNRLMASLGHHANPRFLNGSDRATFNANQIIKVLFHNEVVVDGVKAFSRGHQDHVWIKPRKHRPEEVKKFGELLQVSLRLQSEPQFKTEAEGLKLILDVEKESAVTEAVTLDNQGFPVFDLKNLTKRNSYPMVFISGKPGAAKTTVANYLAATLDMGKKVLITPHLDKNEFPGFDGYFGDGALYFAEGEATDGVHNLDYMMKHKDNRWSVYAGLKALEDEVGSRLIDYSKGKRDFEPIDVFMDEVPSIQRVLGARSKTTPKELKGFFENWVSMAITEPRKVGIRAWILTQSPTVRSLGLEGLASLRDEMTWLRLGTSAIQHATAAELDKEILNHLVAGNATWEATENKLGVAPVALLNDSVAIVPNLQTMINSYSSTKAPEEPRSTPAIVPDLPKEDTRDSDILGYRGLGLSVTDIVFKVYGLRPSRSKAYQNARQHVEGVLDEALEASA